MHIRVQCPVLKNTVIDDVKVKITKEQVKLHLTRESHNSSILTKILGRTFRRTGGFKAERHVRRPTSDPDTGSR